jgi:hypothetical protein
MVYVISWRRSSRVQSLAQEYMESVTKPQGSQSVSKSRSCRGPSGLEAPILTSIPLSVLVTYMFFPLQHLTRHISLTLQSRHIVLPLYELGENICYVARMLKSRSVVVHIHVRQG